MKLRISMILSRAEFEKIATAFDDTSVQIATFDLASDVKSIRFDNATDSLYAELK